MRGPRLDFDDDRRYLPVLGLVPVPFVVVKPVIPVIGWRVYPMPPAPELQSDISSLDMRVYRVPLPRGPTVMDPVHMAHDGFAASHAATDCNPVFRAEADALIAHLTERMAEATVTDYSSISNLCLCQDCRFRPFAAMPHRSLLGIGGGFDPVPLVTFNAYLARSPPAIA